MVPYTDLYGMLGEIRKSPDMWVINKSLADLQTMIHGYSNALFVHGIHEFGTNFSIRFREYLWMRFEWGTSLGWAQAITSHSQSANEAFDRFFEILDEFHAANTY